jgi:hypothetical protein
MSLRGNCRRLLKGRTIRNPGGEEEGVTIKNKRTTKNHWKKFLQPIIQRKKSCKQTATVLFECFIYMKLTLKTISTPFCASVLLITKGETQI